MYQSNTGVKLNRRHSAKDYTRPSAGLGSPCKTSGFSLDLSQDHTGNLSWQASSYALVADLECQSTSCEEWLAVMDVFKVWWQSCLWLPIMCSFFMLRPQELSSLVKLGTLTVCRPFKLLRLLLVVFPLWKCLIWLVQFLYDWQWCTHWFVLCTKASAVSG